MEWKDHVLTFILMVSFNSISCEEINTIPLRIFNQVDATAQFEPNKLSKPSLIPKGYNVNEAPVPKEGLPINAHVEILTCPKIDEGNQNIILTVNLNLEWRDYRLKDTNKDFGKSDVYIPALMSRRIWAPELYFKLNSLSILEPPLNQRVNDLFKITEDGHVIYATRMTLELDCEMDFSLYPADVQTCYLDFESRTDDPNTTVIWAPISFNERRNNPNFFIRFDSKRANTDFKGVTNGSSMSISFKRKVGYHVLQTYLPSAAIVLVTWFSLYIPREHMSDRIVLCTTTLLTLTALFSSVRQNTPSVSYVKAIDIWMVGCVLFVFVFMVLNITVVNISKRKLSRSALRRARILPSSTKLKSSSSGTWFKSNSTKETYILTGDPDSTADTTAEISQLTENEVEGEKTIDPYAIAATRIDDIGKIVVMLAFALFTVVHISWLFSGYKFPQKMQNW